MQKKLAEKLGRIRNVIESNKGKIIAGTTVILSEGMAASAAVNGNWTDGMDAGSSAFSAGVGVFSNPPFNYILGVLVTIIVVMGVARIVKRFM